MLPLTETIIKGKAKADRPAYLSGLNNAALRAVQRDSELAAKVRAETSLASFIKQAWPAMDPSEYAHGWHIDAICEHLDAVLQAEIPHLLITMPPRHMKSLSVSVAFVAYTWARYPWLRFFHASYAAHLALDHSLKTRRLIQSPWYQIRWGDRFKLSHDKSGVIKFDNDKGGSRLSTSVTGIAAGMGGDIIVIDDPHNIDEGESEAERGHVLTWWDETMPSRLNGIRGGPKPGNPRARIIVHHRIAENDLAGHIIEKGDWVHLCLPARYEHDHPNLWLADPRTEDGQVLWEEMFPDAVLKQVEEDFSGADSFAATGQLQQRPAPRRGGLFNCDKLKEALYDDLPAGGRMARYWDMAGTEKSKQSKDPDWTVGTKGKLVGGVLYVIDVVRFRENPAGVETKLHRTAIADGKNVEIIIEQEPGSSGKTVISYYARQLVGWIVRADRPTGSKVERAIPVSAAADLGHVKAPKGAPWLATWLNELGSFPRGKKKDQVDSLSGVFNRLSEGGIRRVVRVRA